MARWLAVITLAACGRFGFAPHGDAAADVTDAVDARPCSPVGHDEDADGFDDACDACPHLADDQTDSDGDGIGDACDPDPGVADTLEMFDPMTMTRPEWTYEAATISGDALHVAGVMNSVAQTLAAPPHDEYYEVGATITAVGSTGSWQISYQITPGGAPGSNYCELYEGTPNNLFLNYVYTPDDVSRVHVGSMAVPGTLLGRVVRFGVHFQPPDITCTAVIDGVMYSAGGAIPGGATNVFSVDCNNLDTDIRYFVKIGIP